MLRSHARGLLKASKPDYPSRSSTKQASRLSLDETGKNSNTITNKKQLYFLLCFSAYGYIIFSICFVISAILSHDSPLVMITST